MTIKHGRTINWQAYALSLYTGAMALAFYLLLPRWIQSQVFPWISLPAILLAALLHGQGAGLALLATAALALAAHTPDQTDSFFGNRLFMLYLGLAVLLLGIGSLLHRGRTVPKRRRNGFCWPWKVWALEFSTSI